MRKLLVVFIFLISFLSYAQIPPDIHPGGVITKFTEPDTLSTAIRDALTPKLGTILYHKDTGISQWEQWDGSEWVTFGGPLQGEMIDIPYSNFNYTQYISENLLKKYIDSNSLGQGYYSVKFPKELSTIDYTNIVYENGEHNAFPAIEKTKEGKLILGYRASVNHLSPIARAEIMISSDNGNSFSDPIIVDDGTDFSGTSFGIRNCIVTQLSTGDLIATYGVNDLNNGDVYYKLSSDGGITWGARDTLVVSGYDPGKISTENKWLEINNEFILPIFSGDLNSELDAGFVRTSDFTTFTYTSLTSGTEKHVETRGYIDHSNNTIIFFYVLPADPVSKMYRQIYDPINNIVVSGQIDVTPANYLASRTDIFFDQNRGEMYLFTRSTSTNPRMLASTDKGLNFNELFKFENITDRPVYGDFVQVSKYEAILFFSTENTFNGEITKMWGTTFNISPVQMFSYDGTNVTEISSGYIPKIDSNQGIDADLLRGDHWGDVNTDIISNSDIITTGNAIIRDGLFTRDSIARVEIIGIDPTGGIVGTDTDHDLILRRNNVEKLRLTSTGATVTGNLTATGAGEFGGTVSGSDPVNADDFVTKGYAESNFATVTSGTFTPAISGLTFTVRKANERKIGDLVFIEVDLINVSGTTGSNGMLLTGFSYGVPSSTNTSLSVGLFTGVSVNYYSVYAEMVGSTTDSVNFTYQFALDGSNASLIPASTTFTAGAIRIAGSYVTDN